MLLQKPEHLHLFVKLNGYGDYVFNNVPVVITTFTVDMPSEVDYIATGTQRKNTLSAAERIQLGAVQNHNLVFHVQPMSTADQNRVLSLITICFVKG